MPNGVNVSGFTPGLGTWQDYLVGQGHLRLERRLQMRVRIVECR